MRRLEFSSTGEKVFIKVDVEKKSVHIASSKTGFVYEKKPLNYLIDKGTVWLDAPTDELNIKKLPFRISELKKSFRLMQVHNLTYADVMKLEKENIRTADQEFEELKTITEETLCNKIIEHMIAIGYRNDIQ
jgi:phosphoribosylformylglycinamidine (FGAM) synthase PurS component